MTAAPLLPKTAPFSPEEQEILNGVVARSTVYQRAWLSGFLAGIDVGQGHGVPAVQPVASARPRTPLTILYASESGNAEALAVKARKAAQKLGFDARVVDMADADLTALPKAGNIVVYASTWGEGEPPQRAADCYGLLLGDTAPRLDGVRFAVLALGDTSYVNFCSTGRAIDARLEALGAVRATPRIDLDLDYAKAAVSWTDKALSALTPPETSATVVRVDFKGALAADEADEPRYSQDQPLAAEVAARVNLNGTGSTRETWHVELSFDAPDFRYEPGDAIGLVPENNPTLIASVLDAVGLGADASLALSLIRSHDVTTLSRKTVEAYAALTGRKDVAALAGAEAFAPYASDRQLVDLLAEHPESLTAPQLLSLLRPLPGRLYSVASSQKAHETEAHILVGAVRWHSHGRERGGVASTYLADRRKAGDPVAIYVKPNRHFRLPQDGSRPIIMIGAGTGVAPYRAFLEERVAVGAPGKSWLVFGERNFTNDFLYQLEWQEHLEAGALARIDLAFSRDQPEKIYVQHRLWEHRADLLAWLEDGAHIYVCGDEKGMARDVDQMLARILAEAAKGDVEAGKARLKELAKAGRYQRDVY